MGPDLLRRIRWGNVGRLAGTLAVIAAVAAWPRLAPPEPALPGKVARPLDGLGTPTATPPAELLVPRPPRAVGRPARRERRSRARGGPGETRSGERSAPQARRAERGDKHRGGGTGAHPGRGGEDKADARENDVGHAEPGGTGPERDPAQTEFGFESG